MKNVKMFKLSLILVLTLFASLFLVNTNVNAEDEETFNYVSFGASNVNGYGLDGYMPEGITAANKATANVYGYERCPEGSYPALIRDYFAQDYEVEHHQLAISSMRAEELHVLLDDNYDGDDYTRWRFTGGANWFLNAEPGGLAALRAAYQNHTANADLITLDIGVNNFGVFLSHNLFKESGDKEYHLEDIDPALAEYFELAKVYVEQVFIEAGLSEEVIETIASFEHSIDIAAYALAGYCYNFDAVVERIYELNPDVTLVVVSVQHLLEDMYLNLPGVGQAISFNYLTGALVRAANLYISGISKYSDSYLFADVSENGHVEFFAKQMADWDGEVSSLDKDMIDCFNVYDDDLFIKETVINYFNATSTPWDVIGYYYGAEVQQALLDAAYYPIAKIMQAGCKVELVDLAGSNTVSTSQIENALLQKIFGELETSVLTKVAQITQGYQGTYEFDEEEFFNIPGVDPEIVRSIAGYAIYTGIGNSFYSHPNRNGHAEIAETIIATLENNTQGDVHAKAEITAILTGLYELAEKYGPSALQFLYGKLEENGIIEQITNEIINIQNQILGIDDAIEAQVVAQLEAVKEYLADKLEGLKENPEETVAETIIEIEWAIASIDAQIADAKAALAKAEEALAPVVEALVELVEYLAAKPEVQDAAAELLAYIENAINAYVEANIDLEAVVEALNEAYETAMVVEAKVVELVLEAKLIKADIEAFLAVAHEKAVELYGEATAAAMAAEAKALVEIEKAYDKALEIYAEIMDAAELAEAEALVEIEAIVNEIIETITGVKADIRSEIEDIKADVEAYVAELEANVVAKAEEIYYFALETYYAATNGEYETSEDSYYVALGDSTAADESYVDLFAAELYLDENSYNNLAVKGMRLEDLYYLLNAEAKGDQYFEANFASEKEYYLNEVLKADIITLGFNGLDYTLAQLGSLVPYENDWSVYFSSEVVELIDKGLVELEKELEKELGIFTKQAMTILESYVYNYVGSLLTYEKLLTTINELNPDALVITVGTYNPFTNLVIDNEGQAINVSAYLEYVFGSFDALHLVSNISNQLGITVLVQDVETEFDTYADDDSEEPVYVKMVQLLLANPDVFLPSAEGHNTIATALYDALTHTCAHVASSNEHDCTLDVVCELCGEVLVEGAEEHTEVVIPAVAATCSTAGYTEGVECSVCGMILVAPEEVAKLNHEFDNNCDNSCNVCGATNPKLEPHVYENKCDDTCNVCGGLRRTLGHVFGDWIVVDEATKHAEGKEGRVCKECGYVEYRTTPKTEGIGAGAVVAIVGGSTVVGAAGAFSVVWFGVKRKRFSDLKNIFKK